MANLTKDQLERLRKKLLDRQRVLIGEVREKREQAAAEGNEGGVNAPVGDTGDESVMRMAADLDIQEAGRDMEELNEWLLHVNGLGLSPTEVRDRKYFQSIYFTMPDGLLIEIATAGPGFAADEDAAALGQALSLPDWLEERRGELEQDLRSLG